jgi:hypothetical protein
MTMMEQITANGYGGKHNKVMNLDQEMLHGRRLDAFVNERRAQTAKTRSLQPRIRMN